VINAPQALNTIGIKFGNGLTGFNNIPPQGLFKTTNTSFNTINLTGGGTVIGIKTENDNVGPQTHTGLNNNKVTIVGPEMTTYGFYFSTLYGFRIPPRHDLDGSINVSGMYGNGFSLSPKGIGIYAFASLPNNRITFIPDPKHPGLGVSAANGNTSYVTAGKGTISPKA
jgi:hypothetical protein